MPRSRAVDLVAAREAAEQLLRALGADVDSAGLEDTPRRVADAYAELLTPRPFRTTTFPNDGGYDELIVARSIPFHSLCIRHLLPFHGIAHVGYLPGAVRPAATRCTCPRTGSTRTTTSTLCSAERP
jgi:GTP cyclohydrolase I